MAIRNKFLCIPIKTPPLAGCDLWGVYVCISHLNPLIPPPFILITTQVCNSYSEINFAIHTVFLKDCLNRRRDIHSVYCVDINNHNSVEWSARQDECHSFFQSDLKRAGSHSRLPLDSCLKMWEFVVTHAYNRIINLLNNI